MGLFLGGGLQGLFFGVFRTYFGPFGGYLGRILDLFEALRAYFGVELGILAF